MERVTDGHKAVISHHRKKNAFRATKEEEEVHLGTTAHKSDDFLW
jgi:hypothetical protein